MEYFEYYIGKFHLIGTTKKQIIDTLKYYKNERGFGKIDIPSEKEISELEKVSITVVFPLTPDDFVKVKIKENVVFNIHSEAILHVKDIVKNYEGYKRGDLYKLDCGVPGSCMLPKDIMEGLKKYNWEKHAKRANNTIKRREETMSELEEQGIITRL